MSNKLLANKSDFKSILLKGVTHSCLLRVGSASSMLAISVILGRTLGPENYGIYAYCLAIINMIAIPTTFGLPEFLVRQISVYNVNKNWSLLKGLLKSSNFFVLMISLVLMGLASLGNIFFIGEQSPSYFPFFISLLLIPFVALSNLRAASLRGLGRIVLSQLPESIIQPIAFLIIFGLATLYFESISPANALSIRVVSILFTFIVGSIILTSKLPSSVKFSKAKYKIRDWLKHSSSFLIFTGLLFVLNQIDIIMLGMFQSKSSVGIYKIVATAAIFVNFVSMAVNTTVGPRMAGSHSLGNYEELQKLTTLSARLSFFGGLPIACGLIFFGYEILDFIYGDEFALGAKALSILCIGHILKTIFGPVTVLLNMTGNQHQTIKTYVAISLLNILLNFILIPLYDIEGAALATAVSQVLCDLLLTFPARRKIGITPYILNFSTK